jgi:hypothetical protein
MRIVLLIRELGQKLLQCRNHGIPVFIGPRVFDGLSTDGTNLKTWDINVLQLILNRPGTKNEQQLPRSRTTGETRMGFGRTVTLAGSDRIEILFGLDRINERTDKGIHWGSSVGIIPELVLVTVIGFIPIEIELLINLSSSESGGFHNEITRASDINLYDLSSEFHWVGSVISIMSGRLGLVSSCRKNA